MKKEKSQTKIKKREETYYKGMKVKNLMKHNEPMNRMNKKRMTKYDDDLGLKFFDPQLG